MYMYTYIGVNVQNIIIIKFINWFCDWVNQLYLLVSCGIWFSVLWIWGGGEEGGGGGGGDGGGDGGGGDLWSKGDPGGDPYN